MLLRTKEQTSGSRDQYMESENATFRLCSHALQALKDPPSQPLHINSELTYNRSSGDDTIAYKEKDCDGQWRLVEVIGALLNKCAVQGALKKRKWVIDSERFVSQMK